MKMKARRDERRRGMGGNGRQKEAAEKEK